MKQQTPNKADLSNHPIWSLKGILCLVVGYCVLHSVLRLLSTYNIAQDDVVGNVLAQVLAPGYIVRQGPLYDMALWFVQQVTGPYIGGFLFLKYVFLTATIAFIYLSARRILDSQLWAGLTACSLTLFYQLGWNIHEGVTHTAALMCFIAASFWAFTRIVQEGGWQNYMLFGIFLGAGFLSKHTFGIFVGLLVLASCLQKPLRQKLFHPLILVSLGVATLMMLPFLLWLYERFSELGTTAHGAVGLTDGGYFERLQLGFPFIIRGPVAFMAPLILVLPLAFPGYLKQLKKVVFAPYTKTDGQPDLLRLVYHMTALAVLFLIIALFVFGIWRLKERYLHPFFLVSIIGLMAIAMQTDYQLKHIKRLLGAILIGGIVILAARSGNFWVGQPFCGPCRQLVPYEGVAKALRDKGFETGTLISGFRFTAGNMRRFFPSARIVSLSHPYFVPPRRELYKDRAQDVAAVWRVRYAADKKQGVPKYIADELKRMNIKNIPKIETVSVPWTHLWRPTGYRVSLWKVIYIPMGLRPDE
ncbi:MAG: glycosyltransferase family 39 protein [Pseudomonadota bacterium]